VGTVERCTGPIAYTKKKFLCFGAQTRGETNERARGTNMNFKAEGCVENQSLEFQRARWGGGEKKVRFGKWKRKKGKPTYTQRRGADTVPEQRGETMKKAVRLHGQRVWVNIHLTVTRGVGGGIASDATRVEKGWKEGGVKTQGDANITTKQIALSDDIVATGGERTLRWTAFEPGGTPLGLARGGRGKRVDTWGCLWGSKPGGGKLEFYLFGSIGVNVPWSEV